MLERLICFLLGHYVGSQVRLPGKAVAWRCKYCRCDYVEVAGPVQLPLDTRLAAIHGVNVRELLDG